MCEDSSHDQHLSLADLHLDVRFKNYGLDSVEVQDNGKGIAPVDFDTIGIQL